MVSTYHYLFLGAALFTIGDINLIAFSAHNQHVTGQIFSIFVITVAAAEAAVGLGIVIAMFKNKETMNINEIDIMKW